jgi:hypothetical protein
MIGIIVAVLSVLLPLLHLGLSKQPRTRSRVIHLLLLYALVLDVGVMGLFVGFIPHVFFADQAAHLIGWPACPPACPSPRLRAPHRHRLLTESG